jgi:His-Xaa-Ser system protein HxsD
VSDVGINDEHTTAELSVDRTTYSKAAVLRTCYWLEKEVVCNISETPNKWVVKLSLRNPSPTLDKPRVRPIDDWIPEFHSALIDSQLRVDIQTETAAIRELVLAKAFAKSGVLEDQPPGLFTDPVRKNNDQNLVSISRKGDGQD